MKTLSLLATLTLLTAASLLTGCVSTRVKVAAAGPVASDAVASASNDGPATLTYVLHNSGKDGDAKVELRKSSGELVDSSTLHVPAGAEAMEKWTLPAGAYRVSMSALGVSGASPVDLAACPSHVVELRVNVSFDGIGGSYHGGQPTCAEKASATKDDVIRGTIKANLIVETPLYAMGSSPRLGFPVKEGARTIDIVATWAPTTPLSDRMSIDLWHVTEEGSKDVAHAAGSKTATIHDETPGTGDYRVGAWLDGDAGIAYDQEVALTITVHYA